MGYKKMVHVYKIYWKSKITDMCGHGELYLTFNEAKETVEKLNIDYPDIHHWMQ